MDRQKFLEIMTLEAIAPSNAECGDKRPVWIQYLEKGEKLVGAIVASRFRAGVFSDLVAPGYRPPAFRGEGASRQARPGDWVVKSSEVYPAGSGEESYRAIVICVVEYDPIAEDDQRWSDCRVVVQSPS